MAEVIDDNTTLHKFYREVTDTTLVIQGSPVTKDKMAAKKHDILRGLAATMACIAGATWQGFASGSNHPAMSAGKKSLVQELHTLIRPEKAKRTVIQGDEPVNAVNRELYWLPSGYHVINDLTIPTVSGSIQIDHVVIGPTGLYCIRADNSASRFHPRKGDRIRYLYESYCGNNHLLGTRKAVDGPQIKSIYHADCLTECLKGRGFDVVAKPLVVMTNYQGEWMCAPGVGECPVIPVRDLRDYIRQAPQNQVNDQERAARLLSLSTESLRFKKAMQH